MWFIHLHPSLTLRSYNEHICCVLPDIWRMFLPREVKRVFSILTLMDVYGLTQVEQVFTAGSVEEIVDNLRGRSEPWAQMALKNIGKVKIHSSSKCSLH